MLDGTKSKKLKKELNLFDVYVIASGTTLSSGFFLLPSISAQQVGEGLMFAYLLALLPLIPGVMSILELATAMPKAGGMYFSIYRAFGPMFGTIGGIGTWISLMLKVAFSLIGMGAYLMLIFPDLEIQSIAIALTLFFGIITILGVKKGAFFQKLIVVSLLIILFGFLFDGVFLYDKNHITKLTFEFSSVISTSAMVYISYVGIVKVASLSEEVKNPDKNLPRGVILGIITTSIIYGLGTYLFLKVLPMEELQSTLTPVADAAYYVMGDYGKIVIIIAALLAFISVANAGIMSSSRYPLAMSRDLIFPKFFKNINKFGTPSASIILTIALIIFAIIFLNPAKIAKLASAFQLILNALACLGVIVMRESKIEAYDPGFKSPFYPYLQIFGAIITFWFIANMGLFSILFSSGIIVLALIWYFRYSKDKVIRSGAIYHLFKRMGRFAYKGLDYELRGILKEKGLRDDDPFEEIIMHSVVIDINEPISYQQLIERVSYTMAGMIDLSVDKIIEQYNEGTKIGATPVIHGVALPHFKTENTQTSKMVMVRAKDGIVVHCENPILSSDLGDHKVYAFFFLVSPENNPTQHLRILAQIAGRVEEETFMEEWISVRSEQRLKETLLHDEQFIALRIRRNSKLEGWIDSMLREIHTPNGCLVAMLQRDNKTIIPNGSTVIKEGDRLTILGDKKALAEFKRLYVD